MSVSFLPESYLCTVNIAVHEKQNREIKLYHTKLFKIECKLELICIQRNMKYFRY